MISLSSSWGVVITLKVKKGSISKNAFLFHFRNNSNTSHHVSERNVILEALTYV